MSANFWTISAFKQAPLKHIGKALVVVVRLLYAAILIFAGGQKIWLGWLTSDTAMIEFTQRLGLLDPGSYQALYLESFAIPLAYPIAWLVTLLQLLTGFAFLIGRYERIAALITLFLYVNFILGGYFFIQALPIMLLPLLLYAIPSGRWWGYQAKD